MSNILFDGTAMQSDSRSKFHGGSEYAKYILKTAINSGYTFDIALNPNLFLEDSILNKIKNKHLRIVTIKSKHDLYTAIESGKYDRFYSALPYNYFDYNGTAKFIGVIHGLRPIEIAWDKYKHKYYYSKSKKFVGWIISKFEFFSNYLKEKQYHNFDKLLKIPNSAFVAVSNHTKYALLNFFPEITIDRIHVYYSPFDIIKSDNKIPNNNNQPFFLLVSGNRFEKNTYRAIKAFDKLFSDNRLCEYNVVITGAKNLPFIKEIKNINKFKLLPYVDKYQLDELYSNSYCLVYPSLNEGFGYPPLLAMSVDTPVIASSSTSIPEVCGDAALYFSPENIDDLCNRILNITNDLELRETLIKKGRERIEYFQSVQINSIHNYLHLIFE